MSKTTRDILQKMNEAKAELRKVLDESGEMLSGEAEKRCADLKNQIVAYGSELEYRTLLDEGEKAQAKAVENRNAFQGFSLARAIRARLDGGRTDDGFERECQQELEHRGCKRRGNEILVPRSYFERRTGVDPISTLNTGAKLVGDTFRPDQFVDVLAEANPLVQLGTSHLSGLVGDLTIPKATSAAGVAWLETDGSTIAATDKTFAQLKASPKYCAGLSTISLGLVTQATPSVDQLLASDMAKALGLAVAKAAIVGAGDDGEPMGLLDESYAVTALPTNEKTVLWAVDVKEELLAQNVDVSKIGYLVNSGAVSDLEGVVTTDGLPVPVETILRGRPYQYFSEVPSESVLVAGDWRDLLICEWGEGVSVMLNPYSQFSTGALQIRAIQAVDCIVRRAESFVTLGGTPASEGSGSGSDSGSGADSGSDEGGNG